MLFWLRAWRCRKFFDLGEFYGKLLYKLFLSQFVALNRLTNLVLLEVLVSQVLDHLFREVKRPKLLDSQLWICFLLLGYLKIYIDSQTRRWCLVGWTLILGLFF
jgi:hypothetical protein